MVLISGYMGSLRMFMQVLAEGSLSSFPPDITQNGGWSSLKPSKGGRLQLVTNFSNCRFCCSDNPSTICQNICTHGCSAL